jgi:CubicO group peptidase (beta-lactamase class C family)
MTMRTEDRFRLARGVLRSGLSGRAFPAATVEVGTSDGPIWQEAFGRLTYGEEDPLTEAGTIFDLASLTKVIATTSLVMRQVEAGRLTLDRPIAGLVPEWRNADRQGVTLAHLLDHSSGLPAHEHFWGRLIDRAEFERAICSLPLAHPPGTHAVYSDPGFMLLGFALERHAGATLHQQFSEFTGAFDEDELYFRPPPALRGRIAPTEFDAWRGRLLQGEVHDENAAALGGVAGHAGLFGTARSVGRFARIVLTTFRKPTVLGSPELMTRFARRTEVPESSRALGWDTMLPTSSCGTRMSSTSIGHTGFTGTSLWIDYERDLYVVLLTNRVYPTRDNAALVALRPRAHDAILEDFDRA